MSVVRGVCDVRPFVTGSTRQLDMGWRTFSLTSMVAATNPSLLEFKLKSQLDCSPRYNRQTSPRYN